VLMKELIKPAINDMYKEVKLSEDDLEYLHRSVKEHNLKGGSRSNVRQYFLILEKCTSVLRVTSMIFLAGCILFMSLTTAIDIDNKSEEIFADIVDNHFENAAIEYTATSLAELSRNFSYLGFVLSNPLPVMKLEGQLTGARPCFILNMPAVQLHYQVNNQSRATVYQTRYKKAIHGAIPELGRDQKPLLKVEEGIQMALWKIGDLLFAIAE